MGPEDLWCGFEYLVGEYQDMGILHGDLLAILAAKFSAQAGESRFGLQCRLAGVLAERKALRFHVALRLASQVPVPQARTALLEMLTRPDMAEWLPGDPGDPGQPANSGKRLSGGHDLRPAVIAALGQMRDPSLLGLFHRLLEKLSGEPTANRNLVAAVQWSLMNLAPGGHGEPMPASVLSGDLSVGPGSDNDSSQEAAASALTPSTAEAMRVVAAIRGNRADGPSDKGEESSRGNGQTGESSGSSDNRSERDELLSGF